MQPSRRTFAQNHNRTSERLALSTHLVGEHFDGCGLKNLRHAGLRVDAVEGSCEGDRLAHMIQSSDPGDGALDAHAEAGVGNAAVAAQVEIPLEGFLGQVVVLDARVQQFEA